MIDRFNGEYRWLSNFWFLESPLIYGGISYATTEHFYQAMKSNSREVNEAIANHPIKGLKAYSKTIDIRSDWDDIKVEVMFYATRYKFSDSNPILKEKLIATGSCQIEEGNWWNDFFWGVDLKTGKGENNLGKIIMSVRKEITGI